MSKFRLITNALFSALLGFYLVFGIATIPTLTQDALLPNPCPDQGCPVIGDGSLSNATRGDIAQVILTIANLLTYIIGALAVLFIVLGGFLLVVGKGETGWKFIKNSLIGLLISILAYTAVYIIGSTAQGTYISF
jgi:hypothetical protein